MSAGYLPCLERFMRRMASPACSYPAPLVERAAVFLELLQGRLLGVLAAVSGEEDEERQAAALVVTAVKVAGVWIFEDGCLGHAMDWFVDIVDALVVGALAIYRDVQAVGNGEPGGDEEQLQQQRGQLLRILSLCLARWLPLYPLVCYKAMEARAEGGAGPLVGPTELRQVRLQRSGRRMVRLAGLARGAAEGRGDVRAAESWGRLLAASAGMAEGEGGQGEEDADEGLAQLAPLLPPPCDVVRAVLPWCSNPLCTSLEGDSEAGLQLVACGGRCGGAGCGGEGPCCCRECTFDERNWQGVA